MCCFLNSIGSLSPKTNDPGETEVQPLKNNHSRVKETHPMPTIKYGGESVMLRACFFFCNGAGNIGNQILGILEI